MAAPRLRLPSSQIDLGLCQVDKNSSAHLYSLKNGDFKILTIILKGASEVWVQRRGEIIRSESREEGYKTLGVGIGISAASQKWPAALCGGDRSPGQVVPEGERKGRS